MKCRLLIPVLFSFFLASCSYNPNNCSGSTEVSDTALAFSTTNVDTIDIRNGRYRHQLSWEILSVYTDRNDAHENCRNKRGTLYVYNNPVIDSTIELTCSRSLSWYGKKTIAAGENLLGIAVEGTGLAKKSGSSIVDIDADSMATGIYTFYITAGNKWGAHLSDSINIIYR